MGVLQSCQTVLAPLLTVVSMASVEQGYHYIDLSSFTEPPLYVRYRTYKYKRHVYYEIALSWNCKQDVVASKIATCHLNLLSEKETIMDMEQKTSTLKIQAQHFQARQKVLDEIKVEQERLENLKDELSRIDSKIADSERMSDNS